MDKISLVKSTEIALKEQGARVEQEQEWNQKKGSLFPFSISDNIFGPKY